MERKPCGKQGSVLLDRIETHKVDVARKREARDGFYRAAKANRHCVLFCFCLTRPRTTLGRWMPQTKPSRERGSSTHG